MTTRAPIRLGFANRIAVILSEVPACRDGAEGSAVAFPRGGAAKFLILALLFSAQGIVAQQPATSSPVVLDRVVAVVNKQVILSSQLDDEMRLSILEPNRGGELTEPEALERLISRSLIVQQIREQDLGTTEPTQEQVDARVSEIRKDLPACVRENCASDAGWQKFLSAHGLTSARVESYLRYRLEILNFIELRFRQGIQITQQQIETYYHDTLLPQYQPGDSVPPLDQVSSRIQEILLQQQVNVLFDNWLSNLRQQGDVEVLDPALASALAPAPESSGTQSPGSESTGTQNTAAPPTSTQPESEPAKP
jgi:peptidyl-prolyl cis-trans isomerase SurA